jgi:hypothetical protein
MITASNGGRSPSSESKNSSFASAIAQSTASPINSQQQRPLIIIIIVIIYLFIIANVFLPNDYATRIRQYTSRKITHHTKIKHNIKS